MGGSDNSDNGLRATPVQPNPPQLPPAPKAPWMEMLPTSLGEDWCSLLGDLGLVGISGRGTSEGGVAGAVTSEDAAPAKASDCDVVVGGQSFKAHRAVLAAAVPSLRPTLGMQARVDPGEDTSASVNAVSGAFDLNGNGGNDRVKLVVEDRVDRTERHDDLDDLNEYHGRHFQPRTAFHLLRRPADTKDFHRGAYRCGELSRVRAQGQGPGSGPRVRAQGQGSGLGLHPHHPTTPPPHP